MRLNQPKAIEMTANQGVNVRLFPRTDQNNICWCAKSKYSLLLQPDATPMFFNENWIQISADGVESYVGWVIDWALDTTEDVSSLSVVRPGDTTTYGPMQAFYFTSGIGDAQCNEAPDSGMLIQTPQGVGLVNFRIK